MNEDEIPEAGASESPESLVSLIDQLIEPAAPLPVPMVPQTWGWAVLAALLVAALVAGLWRWHQSRVANAYRRTALAALAQAATTAELAAILRRAALAAYPRAEVASLTGHDWTAFLSRSGKRDFPDAAGEELRRAPYRSPDAAPSRALRDAASDWLRTHRTDAKGNAAGKTTAKATAKLTPTTAGEGTA